MEDRSTFQKRWDALIEVTENQLATFDAEGVNSLSEKIAKAYGEEQRKICGAFQLVAGMPLGAYLRLRKLERCFASKVSGKKDSWEEAALMYYSNYSSFSREFKNQYGIKLTEAEKIADEIPLTKPLFLEQVLQKENFYVAKGSTIHWEEEMGKKVLMEALKNYEIYGDLFDVSPEQYVFARDYVKKNCFADLEYVLYILFKEYPDRASEKFSEVEEAAFDCIIRYGFHRRTAERLVRNLLQEGKLELSKIDREYFMIMSDVLCWIEDEVDTTKAADSASGTGVGLQDIHKYPTYADYLQVKTALLGRGYDNYWDLYQAITGTMSDETWEESIEAYFEVNPKPIKGNWTEEEYLKATDIFFDVSMASVFEFVETVYGREKFAKMNGYFEELVFGAMLLKHLSENEAKEFVCAEMNDEIAEFLRKDSCLNFKYQKLVERGVLA